MQDEEFDESRIDLLLDEIEVKRWLDELLESAVRDGVSTLHFDIGKHTGRVRQRKSAKLSIVADQINRKTYSQLIFAIKLRFGLDPNEARREQDGTDDSGLRVALIRTEYGLACCIKFEFLRKNLEPLFNLSSADSDTLLSVFEKRRGLVFTYVNQLWPDELNVARCRMLKLMTQVFDGEKILFVPWGAEKNITVPQVLYTTPLKEKPRRHEWFDGLLLQQPDALFLPYDQRWPTAKLCRYAEDHLVIVEVYSRSFLFDMLIPGSWLRSHCLGVLMIDTYPRICLDCRKSYVPAANELNELKLTTSKIVEFSRGTGCAACAGKGIKGKQLSMTLAADGASIAPVFSKTPEHSMEFWRSLSPTVRSHKAQLVKDGLVASYPTLRPEYWVEETLDLDTLK